MRRNGIVIIAAVSVLGILAALYLMRDPDYNWYRMYGIDDTEPFGLRYFKEVLEESNGIHEVNIHDESFNALMQEAWEDEEPMTGTYLYVGASKYLDNTVLDSILRFIDRGNTAFISSNYIPYQLHDTVFQRGNAGYQSKSALDSDSINLNFYSGTSLTLDSTYVFQHRVKDTTELYSFYSYNPHWFRDSLNYSSLGYFDNNRINFLEITWGKGKIYLHSTPLAFTNLHFIEEEGFNYINQIISKIPEGDIHWDNSRYTNYDSNRRHRDFSEGPLDFLLEQQSLRWAWYLLLGSVFAYLLLNTKRKQRIIPLITKNKNASLDFVQTVGNLHYAEGNNRSILMKEREILFYFIRKQLHINPKLDDPDFNEKLAHKSGIELKDIRSIMEMSKVIESNLEISSEFLISYHQKIEAFYQKVR